MTLKTDNLQSTLLEVTEEGRRYLHRGRILKSEKWKEEVTVQPRHIPTFALRVMENTKNQVKTIEYPRTFEAGIF